MIQTFAVVLSTALSAAAGNDQPAEPDNGLPTVHVEMAIQAESYSGGDSTYAFGFARLAETGFTIREAKAIIEGNYENYLEYNLEFGSASCLDGGFMVIEAGLMLNLSSDWKAGITKGHVLRGFEMYDECVQLLTAEKPVFAKKFSPCHPLGFAVEFDKDLGEHSGIFTQLVIAEGSGGTLDDEHDINLGIHYRTPLPGLTLAAGYDFWRWNAPYNTKDSIPTPGGARDDYTVFWTEHKQIYDGHRAIAGLRYNDHNLELQGEVFLGKGFKDALDIPYYADIWADSSSTAKTVGAPFEDLEMNAVMVQAGYSLPLESERFTYLQPYVQYQWWDQAANLEGDYRSSFLTVGINVGLGPGDARFKMDYQTCLGFANDGGLPGYGEDQQADRLLIRLQVGI